ncbi:S-methyl-5-thioribose-1-phosphate isomerase [Amycolatopsis cihanbeyliensis]|uniref:Methylthioribose-1-phosphate isomerase n=1 Tax=Amycolatopsis cihanbeyliensis TaxID=1128664 RepID=A0A542CUR3_AMYCI|nr:S-methyl-5-thioribose-1-phosphate isomerase [Amycolatopsis cihanbeyliensis]TQI94558.1 methylthioribose-1-phosphate isomerase [Amycolatopsis cihanbeyliensis]
MQRTIDWDNGEIVIVDQCSLPHTHRILRLRTVEELVAAIQRLAVRGAPALGAAGALGTALAARLPDATEESVRAAADRLARARPTAVNLSWGVRQALAVLPDGADAVLARARNLLDADERVNRLASGHAAEEVLRRCPRRPLGLLTHCNSGRLATVAWGTALGVVWHLAEAEAVGEVLVDETRPLLQGARLTAWELAEAGIAYRVLPDGAAATAMAQGMVDCVLVGADRIAANGDVVNKVGTYGLALAAAAHEVPFLVVAPTSTVDTSLPDGTAIEIEQRSPEEVTRFAGEPVAPEGAAAFNPAFDLTPARLVTAVITEHGVRTPAPSC